MDMGEEHEQEAATERQAVGIDADEATAEGALPEVDADAVAEDAETTDVRLEREEHGEVAAEADDDVHAQAEEQPQPDEVPQDVPVPDAQDTAGAEDDVAENLRGALGAMREEADRIAALGTGPEQVEAAERFAEDAGRLDEQVGSAARSADDERG